MLRGEFGGVEKMSSAASGTAAGLAVSGGLRRSLLAALLTCAVLACALREALAAAAFRIAMGSERNTPRESVKTGVRLLETWTVRLVAWVAGPLRCSSAAAGSAS